MPIEIGYELFQEDLERIFPSLAHVSASMLLNVYLIVLWRRTSLMLFSTAFGGFQGRNFSLLSFPRHCSLLSSPFLPPSRFPFILLPGPLVLPPPHCLLIYNLEPSVISQIPLAKDSMYISSDTFWGKRGDKTKWYYALIFLQLSFPRILLSEIRVETNRDIVDFLD